MLLLSTAASEAQNISSVQPASGAEGTQVRIYGSGFDATASNNTVTFGSTQATLDSASTNVLYARVPAGESGRVSLEVATGGTSLTYAQNFSVLTGGSSEYENIEFEFPGFNNPDANDLDWVDFDNDGDLDLSTAGEETFLLRNDDNEEYTAIDYYGFPQDSRVAEWGDYDADGDMDIAIIADQGTNIYKQSFDGATYNYDTLDVSITNVSNGALDWGDYDQDGDLDLLLAGFSSEEGQYVTRVYRNDGNNNFIASADLMGINEGDVEWGDYDGDGDLDIAMLGDSNNGYITKIMKNTGDDSFSDIGAPLPQVETGEISWADYDQDGDLDLALTGRDRNSDYVTHIYKNEGDDTFTDLDGSMSPLRRTSLEWGDMDADGDPDLLLTGLNPEGDITEKLLLNVGADYFQKIETSLHGFSEGDVGLADFNDDGSIDVIMTGNPQETPNTFGGLENTVIYQSNDITPVPTFANATYQNSASTVGWKGVAKSELEKYNIYRSTTPIDSALGPANFTASYSVTVSELDPDTLFAFQDTEVEPQTSYYYRLTAVSATSGESGFSPQAVVSTASNSQLAVTDLQPAEATPGSIVRIFGANFDAMPANNTITFGTVTATVDSVKGNALFTTVPMGVSGPVKVSVSTGSSTATYAGLFTGITGGEASFAESTASLEKAQIVSQDWGDYDGDGDLDLVVTGEDSTGSPLSRIYRQNNLTFSPAEAGIENLRDGSVRWGDYDGDGDLDLFLSGTYSSGQYNTDSKATIYRNEGNGSFTDLKLDIAPFEVTDAAWGDYDGDGDLDIALFGRDTYEEGIHIIENTGGGSFELKSIGGDALTNGSIDWNDFDGDGDLDLLLSGETDATYSPEETIIMRNENGNFSEAFTSIDGLANSSASWGDYDNDGDADVAITGSDGSDPVSKVYENTGNNSFSEAASLQGVEGGTTRWGDADSDGDLDLLLSGEDIDGNAITTVYQNEGNNTFTPLGVGLPGLLTGTAAWSDYDGDGDLDVSIMGQTTDYNALSKLFLNGGLGAVSNVSITDMSPSSGAEGTRVHVNGFGFNSTPSENTVTFGSMSATVDSADLRNMYVSVPSGVQGPVQVEVDNGKASTVATDLFTGVTQGAQLESGQVPLGGFRDSAVDVGDFDNDGDMDFVITGNAASGFDENMVTKIYKNDGNGNFSVLDIDLQGVSEGDVSWGDFDRDDDLDLIVSGEYPDTDPYTQYYRNDGNDTFTAMDVGLKNHGESLIQWVDFNEDGYLDVDINGTLYRNLGDGSVSEVETSYSGTTAWDDYNGDGVPDVAVSSSGETNIYRNDGSGGFTNMENGMPATIEGEQVWIDYDSDGDQDLFLFNSGSYGERVPTLYENQGDGSFAAISAGFIPANEIDPLDWGDRYEWGDYNADGNPDIVIIGSDDKALYRNDGSGQFTRASNDIKGTNFLGGIDDGSPFWIDTEGDGDLDLIATGAGEEVGSEVYSESYENIPKALVSPPGNLSFEMESQSPKIYWTSSSDSDIAKYVIFRGQTVGGLSQVTTVSADDTTFSFGETETGLYAIKAENSAGERSPFVGPVSYMNRNLEITSSWQLVSTGLKSNEVILYGESIAYSFGGTYSLVEDLFSGSSGYWVKNREGSVTRSVQGQGLTEFSDAFGRSSQWYIIGSLADTATVNDPNNVLGNTPIYRYDEDSQSYVTVDKLHPGEGHWVYASKEGELSYSIVDPNEQSASKSQHGDGKKESMDCIVFSTRVASQPFFYAQGSVSKSTEAAYRLPPKAPEPGLDVRTQDGFRIGEGSTTPIELTASKYPVHISLQKNEENNMAYRIIIREGDRKIMLPLTADKSQTISKPYDNISLKQLPKDEVPVQNELSPNYPNPFNPTTTIEYQVASQAQVQMNVYNVLGQRVRRLVDATKQPGRYEVRFDGSNLASGVYYLRIQIGGFKQLQKMTLIK